MIFNDNEHRDMLLVILLSTFCQVGCWMWDFFHCCTDTFVKNLSSGDMHHVYMGKEWE